MLNFDFSIDLHMHPTYKAVGNALQQNKTGQPENIDNKGSLWYYNPPSLSDKLLNDIVGVTKFSQANFTASVYGNVLVMVVALGCTEKWFLNNKLGTGLKGDVLLNFTTEFGKRRIDAIQNMKDYFADFKQELQFMEDMDGKIVNVDGNPYKYQIVNNFKELQAIMLKNEAILNSTTQKKITDPVTVAVILSIEGMHVLNCGLDPNRSPENIIANGEEVLRNAAFIKNHPHRPWFITFAHHFYNELCGHSRSLRGIVAKNCDQETGLHHGFTPLGMQVLNLLLDNKDGKRILIDIKHLSPEGREEFFALRREKYPDLPVIISHGVCNGLPDKNTQFSHYPELGDKFDQSEINFYDDEILLMVDSKGIIGLQLDERRLGNENTIKQTKHSFFKNKIMHYRSELLWNQIQYIAELLDANGKYAWGNIAIGSDYDGIIDPLNSFWTTEQYPDLKSYLERHAHNYLENKSGRLKNDFNKISADTIVQNIFQTNAWNFFQKWF